MGRVSQLWCYRGLMSIVMGLSICPALDAGGQGRGGWGIHGDCPAGVRRVCALHQDCPQPCNMR